MFPVDNTLVNLTGKFGARTPMRLTNGKMSGSFHYGVDLAPEAKGTPLLVYAVAAGVIESTGRKSDAGNFIILRRPNGDAWRYCHLSSVAVHPGEQVRDGQAIGRMGATGNVNGVHLHLEAYPDKELRTRVDPLPLIWNEPNPARAKASVAPAPKPAPAAAPAPAPAPAPAAKPRLRVGARVRLSGSWVRFKYSNLRGYMNPKHLPAGEYTVAEIAPNGNPMLEGNGMQGWVDKVVEDRGGVVG